MVTQSPEPGARGQTFDVQFELEFRGVGFCGGRNTREPGENPRGKERTNNNKLNPHETGSTGIEPGSQRWEASAYPPRHPCSPNYWYTQAQFSLAQLIHKLVKFVTIKIEAAQECSAGVSLQAQITAGTRLDGNSLLRLDSGL